MSDFSKWLREYFLVYEGRSSINDLARLCIQQHDTLMMRVRGVDEADCRRAADVVLKSAEAFKEYYALKEEGT